MSDARDPTYYLRAGALIGEYNLLQRRLDDMYKGGIVTDPSARRNELWRIKWRCDELADAILSVAKEVTGKEALTKDTLFKSLSPSDREQLGIVTRDDLIDRRRHPRGAANG
jgi:hypothetical protein